MISILIFDKSIALDPSLNKQAKAMPVRGVPINRSAHLRPKAPTPIFPSLPSDFRKYVTKFSYSLAKAALENLHSPLYSHTHSPQTPNRPWV